VTTTPQALYGHLPIMLQELLVSVAGWRSFRQRYGSPFAYSLSTLQRSDFLSKDEVQLDQEQRLRATIQWAVRTVPYYRDLFRREGIDPSSIRSVEDLVRVPTLSKTTVREHAMALRSEGVPRRRMIPARTSGTTGTALHLVATST
jgi:phenylacetate-CoA ligase